MTRSCGRRGALRERGARYEVIVDLGCGRGDCARTSTECTALTWAATLSLRRVSAADAVKFRQVDLEPPAVSARRRFGARRVSVETIEHVENPRAPRPRDGPHRPAGGLDRRDHAQSVELDEQAAPVVTNQFQAFQEAPGLYPAHITALVEDDLRRIARECGLVDVEIRYTDQGRIPFTGAALARTAAAGPLVQRQRPHRWRDVHEHPCSRPRSYRAH